MVLERIFYIKKVLSVCEIVIVAYNFPTDNLLRLYLLNYF